MKLPKVRTRPMKAVITLGLVPEEKQWFLLDLDQLSRHVFIAGGTGGGKTTLLLLIMRQLAAQGVGFTYVTPHPDGREKFLQWAALNGIGPARLVDVHASPECAVSIDPSAHPPKHCNPLQSEAWLNSTVDRVVSAILRNVPKAEQEVMNRLKRWLKNVLYCCGRDVEGQHLGLDKALVLLDPGHPDFDYYMGRLWDYLPDEIRADFRNLSETKNARQREQWVESTINRLRELLSSPLVRQMFGQRSPALDDEAIILNDMIQTVSVPESEYLSRDQGNVIAGLRISSMNAAARRIGNRLPEHERHYHFVLIDEAENFLGEDLKTGFQELRKFKMPLVVVFQDISCMLKGDSDYMSKIASQCGVQISFQQQDPDSLEYLSKAFAYPFLNMTERYQLQVLPAGFTLFQGQSVTIAESGGMSVTQAQSMTRTRSVTDQEHEGTSFNRSLSRALSSTHSEGTSEGSSEGTNWSLGRSDSRTATDSLSQARGTSRSRSASDAQSTQQSESTTDGESEQESLSVSASKSSQKSSSRSFGTSHGESSGHSDSRSSGQSRGEVVGGDHRTDNRSEGRGYVNTFSRTEGSSESTTAGSSEGESKSAGLSLSQGRSKSSTAGTSRGQTHTEGTTDGESETQTAGTSVGTGSSASASVGGSSGTNSGRNSSDSRGQTRTDGESTGSSSGRSSGRSEGLSDGRTDGVSSTHSRSVSVGFSQTPIARAEGHRGSNGLARAVGAGPDLRADAGDGVTARPDASGEGPGDGPAVPPARPRHARRLRREGAGVEGRRVAGAGRQAVRRPDPPRVAVLLPAVVRRGAGGTPRSETETQGSSARTGR